MFLRNVAGRVTDLVRASPFIRHNAVFFVGSLGVAILNYLFYPVLGRMMSPSDFGEVQALISLFMQGTIFLNVLSLITIHVTVNADNESKRNQILLGLERIAVVVGWGILMVALLSVQKLKDFLNFHEIWPFLALMLALGLTIPLVLRMAFLRGRKQFAKSALTDGIGSATKLLIAPILIALGFKAFGAIMALAISQIISLGFVIVWARRSGFHGFGLKGRVARLSSLKPQFTHALALLVASSAVAALFSLDILAMKHYFSPQDAGLYAGITTIGRIIFFLTTPVTGVLLTMVSLNQAESKNRLQLLGSLGLVTLLGGLALIVLSLIPELSIKILVGSKYLTYAPYLPKLGLIMLILSLANALLMYNISLRRYAFAAVPIVALALTLILIAQNHVSVSEIINSMLIGSSVLILGLIVLGILPSKMIGRE